MSANMSTEPKITCDPLCAAAKAPEHGKLKGQATMDKMLDAVKWEQVEAPIHNPEGLPFPTHQGVLQIGSLRLECFVLNDGRRIFSGDAIEQFMSFLNQPVDVRTVKA